MHTPSLFVAAALLCTATLAAQIHVSPTGNDTTGDGSSALPYKTVSKAISTATSGDVIQLAAGTFGDDEDITVSGKDLTLVGAGVGQTIVRPHATNNRTLYGTTVRIALLAEGGSRMDVRNMTVDGAFRMPPSGRLYGVHYRDGADGTAEGLDVTNCRADPLTGAQRPIAAYVRGDSTTDPCEVTFTDCYLHEFGKNGFAAVENSVVDMLGCRIVGAGPVGVPLPAQNGVQYSLGATGTIRGNVVSEIIYTGPTWTATGILPYNAAPGLVIEDNRVVRCQSGIYLIQSPAATATAVIRRNQVTEGTNGIINFGATGTTITDNVIANQDDYTYDDVAASTWSGNNYGDYSGSGSYTVDGPGAVVDTTPRGGHDGFGMANAVAIGATPTDLLVADLDGTGELDFATVNDPASAAAMPTLSIGLQGTTAGTFAVSSVSFGSAGARPMAITSGEFNGSPGIDLAVVTENENKFYVFSNDGSGAFTLAHSATLPAGSVVPNDIASGNFDGDGDDDLVVATRGGIGAGNGVVLTNNGATWAASVLPGTFTTDCMTVATGTIDAGTTVDIVLLEGDASTGRAHVYSNTGGSFAAIAGSPFTIDAAPTSVAVGDLDGDGDNDIALTSNKPMFPLSPGSASVMVNNLPTGLDLELHDTGIGPTSIAIGDLDKDADPDTVRMDAALCNLVGTDASTLGEFGLGGFATNLQANPGGSARAVAIAEVTGDAYGDLVIADAAGQRVVILPGQPRARIDFYGAGCAGTSGLIPRIGATGAPALPKQPNLTFGISLDNARAHSVAVLFASGGAAASLNSCEFLLSSVDVVWNTFTTAAGRSGVSIPVPAAPPSFIGGEIYFQWVVLDPDGGFANFLSMSRGLKMRVGH